MDYFNKKTYECYMFFWYPVFLFIFCYFYIYILLFKLLFCGCWCFACICICALCTCSAIVGQKKALDPLRLRLQRAMIPHLGPREQTQALRNRIQPLMLSAISPASKVNFSIPNCWKNFQKIIVLTILCSFSVLNDII